MSVVAMQPYNIIVKTLNWIPPNWPDQWTLWIKFGGVRLEYSIRYLKLIAHVLLNIYALHNRYLRVYVAKTSDLYGGFKHCACEMSSKLIKYIKSEAEHCEARFTALLIVSCWSLSSFLLRILFYVFIWRRIVETLLYYYF